jgi:hypothetical protein
MGKCTENLTCRNKVGRSELDLSGLGHRPGETFTNTVMKVGVVELQSIASRVTIASLRGTVYDKVTCGHSL